MFDDLVAGAGGTRGAAAVQAWTRVESGACARRLAAMVLMLDDAYAASVSSDREQWCIDNWAAVCAHIGAAQRLTSGAASSLLLVGVALRERFPKVGALFTAGLITYPLVRAIVTRGALVKDPEALHALDSALAQALQTWAPMGVDKTEQSIDAFIAAVDPDAVRRTHTSARGRCVDIAVEDGSGVATLFGTLFAPDAAAVDARLTALVETVCPGDPRTRDQRRADAMGVLAHGGDRLGCLCETPDCPAGDTPPSTGVVIYVVAHQDTATSPAGPACPPAPADLTADAPPEPAPASDVTDAPTPADTDGSDAPAPDANSAAAECAGLDGVAPPMFTKPLREMTLAEVMAPRAPGHLATISPATMMGGAFLPGAIARRAARTATLTAIIHPGQAPPEPRYRPSKKLADFVRCRDLTCRFPGCRVPATKCDLDHTIAYPCGATQASNLKALCRKHHLLKTFWGGETGWRERQHEDGTLVWTAPDCQTYTTTPGSRLLFPSLSQPTAPAVATGTPSAHTAGLRMPRRRRTRAQDRSRRIDTERALNRTDIEAEAAATAELAAVEPAELAAEQPAPPTIDDDPPPF